MKLEEMDYKELAATARSLGIDPHRPKKKSTETLRKAIADLGGIELEEKREAQLQGTFRQEPYTRDCMNVVRSDGSIVAKIMRHGRQKPNSADREILPMERHAEVICAALNQECRGEA